MADEFEVNNALLFALYAERHPSAWRLAIGRTIVHTVLGDGVIQGVDGRYVVIEFSEGTKRFGFDKLREEQYFCGMSLPEGLSSIEIIQEQLQRQRREAEEQRRQDEERRENERRRIEAAAQQRAREAAAFKEFADLRAKYRATNFKEVSPTSRLYMILKRIDSGEVLDDAAVEWLNHRRLYATIALYYEMQLDLTGDLWNIVKASRFWRRARQPERTVHLTEYLYEGDDRLNSAILTTRGGAFRDLGDLHTAEECGQEAITLRPRDYYPYNLLGAIYFQYGLPERGDEYFSTARMLGATPQDQEHEMRNAMERSGPHESKIVAKYLIGKDPERYKWAEHYLDQHG